MQPNPFDFTDLWRRPMLPLASGSGGDWDDYLVDTFQRTVLTWDVLRRSGNLYLEHLALGRPPVLVFPHETVLDGTTLERPVNYLLLRIVPDPAHPTDNAKRPIVVVDPRAGHGPGIGGFKADSQIGLALRNGYPCYFVSFRPQPVPGQTIEDVGRAEAAFLQKVAELHPEAEDRPVVIGNCQAGWAVAMLSAAAPELMSVVILNGAPLSYWSGEVGHNPMRYLGGLLGGTWLAALASDLGGGLFDGANLVGNFENLDPANTWVKKPYNLFSNVDREADRFLGFERWWSGHFLLTKAEIQFITDELFVGNKLVQADVTGSSGVRIDLRNVRAPIVVFASKGDNITPPQQALNWILDTYRDIDDLRACGQVIIYMLHESIGHLGIFVSSKVAKREHRAMIDNLDVISALAPGLYEMTVRQGQGGQEIGFERRDLDDIRALDDGRRDETFFLPVQRISQANNQVYELMLSPWMQMLGTPVVAELMRRHNPQRMQRWLCSDLNPVMTLVEQLARAVRDGRRPAAEDNPFRRAEARAAELMGAWLDQFRDFRDHAVETAFYATYAPLRAAMRPEEEQLLEDRRNRLDQRAQQARQLLREHALARMAEGGVPAAVLRILLWVSRRRKVVDARRFRLAERALTRSDLFRGLSSRKMRDALREQFFLLIVDEERALAALSELLADGEERSAALALVDKIATDVGGLDSEQEGDLERIRALLSEQAPPARARPRKPPEARPLH